MAIDKEKKRKQFMEMVKNAKPIECPDFLKDVRLEDAFKEPVTDEDGYSEPIPAIFNDYHHTKNEDGVLILSSQGASLVTNLYSKYLDDEALVWDSNKERLLLYVPDPNEPRMAFKSPSWQFAKRLKPEFEDYITLRDVYYEYLEGNK